jgi:hypothetical protein
VCCSNLEHRSVRKLCRVEPCYKYLGASPVNNLLYCSIFFLYVFLVHTFTPVVRNTGENCNFPIPTV